MPNPSSLPEYGGRPIWLWGAIAVVVLLNAAAVWTAVRRARRTSARVPVPPGRRRLTASSVLLWLCIVILAAIIGVGIGTLGSG